ncbi:IS6 family transposase [Vacuolonema iberomarrocanum]|uniref:IS6 family transposase n=1 Tax=Vacuolonema iberomarrocanum TaxID=3454632 RepID=UPI0019EE2020|nr:IS6 family transposase [filamentous cyanobacterium LEGE 07170]
MSHPVLFKWKHFQPEIILLNVRWYCRYALSYRDLEEMMAERGLSVDHSTINRWVLQYAPELDKRCRPHLRPTNDSWKVDETYVNVKGAWKYLYRAVDSRGQTLDFMLSAKRDSKAAKRFFKKVLTAQHTQTPRVINVDQNAAYPPAVDELKQEDILSEDAELRPTQDLNNLIEQDHRRIKRLIKPGLGFGSFHKARRTLKGYEAMAMIRKGQIQTVDRDNVTGQISFIHKIFGIAA